jgi:hypothetical protein
MKFRFISMAVLLIACFQSTLWAHGGHGVKLHVNPKWKECSFQLDSSLTRKAWRQFTREAGLVTYFRPLTDARPMGVGNYELSILQWQTGIDESEDAWNNTFVHPDSNHWLTGGEPLAFPGLMFRTGVTSKIDVGAYWTKSPGANYGFYGGQVQYNLVNDLAKKYAASARLSFVSLYGPKDVDFTVYGLDLMASKTYSVWSDRISVSPYASVSTYLACSHEKSAVVELADENLLGAQASVGAVTQISFARIGVEYNLARINTLSFKLGVQF